MINVATEDYFEKALDNTRTKLGGMMNCDEEVDKILTPLQERRKSILSSALMKCPDHAGSTDRPCQNKPLQYTLSPEQWIGKNKQI